MKRFLITLMLPMMVSMSASASLVTIDEGADIQTGTLTYDGIGGALIGTDINFSLATGVDTPVNQGSVLDCQSCLLNFITGANNQEGPAVWRWDTGGSVSLDGDLYDGLNLITSGNLLSGTFNSIDPLAVGGGSSLLFASVGNVVAVQALVDFFGIVNNSFTFANTELALQSCTFAANAGFGCGIDNADLAIANAVPTPASMPLFGIGLASLLLAARKRK